MVYIDGFVLAVPTANKQKLIAHATKFDSMFIEHGATRVVECWGGLMCLKATPPTSRAQSKPRRTRQWRSRGSR